MRKHQIMFVAPKDYKTLVDADTGKPLLEQFPDGIICEYLTDPYMILSVENNRSIAFIGEVETHIMKEEVIL